MGVGVGVNSGMHFLDRMNKKVIGNFRKGSVILMRSTSKFSVPVPVHRYIIVSASSCGVGEGTTPTPSGTRKPTGPVGPRVPTIRHRPRAHNNSVLGIVLTFIPRSIGTVDDASFRTCLIGSDGCCLCCACLDTRKGT